MIEIKKRDLLIKYEIDKMTVNELSEFYGLKFSEMKAVLRQSGIKVRKLEERNSLVEEAPEVIVVDNLERIAIDFKINSSNKKNTVANV